MKKTLIGIFLALIGTLQQLVVFAIASNNLVSENSILIGQIMTTVHSMGLTSYFVLSSFLLILGLAILGIEYFKKGE